MWSLPDIGMLNRQAKTKKFKNALKLQLRGCEMECSFCEKPATKASRQEWYDIFSKDPKGVIGLCEEHEQYFGSIPEGFFWCDCCARLFIENYTWELYYSHDENGDCLCLNCKADRHVENKSNWIRLTEKRISEIDFDEIRNSPHIIAVDGPLPKGLKFFKNVEMDSSNGGRLTGFSTSEDSPDGAVREIKNILLEAKQKGKREALLILDAAYQFSVSVGVYLRA